MGATEIHTQRGNTPTPAVINTSTIPRRRRPVLPATVVAATMCASQPRRPLMQRVLIRAIRSTGIRSPAPPVCRPRLPRTRRASAVVIVPSDIRHLCLSCIASIAVRRRLRVPVASGTRCGRPVPWYLHGSMPLPTHGSPDRALRGPPHHLKGRGGESHARCPGLGIPRPQRSPLGSTPNSSSPLKAFRRPKSDLHTTGPPLPDQRAASCENSPCRRAPKTAAQPRNLLTGALPPQPPSLPPTWSNWTASERLPS